MCVFVCVLVKPLGACIRVYVCICICICDRMCAPLCSMGRIAFGFMHARCVCVCVFAHYVCVCWPLIND